MSRQRLRFLGYIRYSDPEIVNAEECVLYQTFRVIRAREKIGLLHVLKILYFVLFVPIFFFLQFTDAMGVFIIYLAIPFLLYFLPKSNSVPTSATSLLSRTNRRDDVVEQLYLAGVKGSEIIQAHYIETMIGRERLVFYLFLQIYLFYFFAVLRSTNTIGMAVSIFACVSLIFIHQIYLFSMGLFRMYFLYRLNMTLRNWMEKAAMSNFHFLSVILLYFLLCSPLLVCIFGFLNELVNPSIPGMANHIDASVWILIISAVLYGFQSRLKSRQETTDVLKGKADLAFDYCVQYVWNGEKDPELVANFFDRPAPEKDPLIKGEEN